MEEEIRAEAYKIYVQRRKQGIDGDHVSDWHEAERRIKYIKNRLMYERMDR